MKVTLQIILSLIIGSELKAQITVTRAHMPQPNDSFIYQPVNSQGLNYAATGAGFTWDFSRATNSPQPEVKDKYQPANQTPYGFLFMGAYGVKIADSIGAGQLQFKNLYRYVQVTSTAYSAIGVGFTLSMLPLPLGGRYSDPDEIYRLPMSYNMNWEGSYRLAIPLVTFGSYVQTGYRKAEVDGWGTILLPGGRSYQVLRVKAEIEQIDSFDIQGNAFAVPNRRTEYAWVSRDFRAPVFEVTAPQIGPGQQAPAQARYLVSGSKAQNEPGVGLSDKSVKNWKTFPNPAYNEIIISGLDAGNYRLTMRDILGKIIISESRTIESEFLNIQLPIEISNGQYLITLENGEIVRSWKHSVLR